MRFHRLKILALLTFLVIQGRAPAEEGEAKPGNAPLAKDEREFFEHTQRLNSLGTRIDESEKQFRDLVQRKDMEKNPAEKERIIKQMNEVSKERNKSVEEFNKVRNDLALRYPNQGIHLNRRYLGKSKKSTQELEGAEGLEALLTRTKVIIDERFRAFADEDPQARKAKIAQPEKVGTERLRLEK